ncbi:ABC transporter related protein [Dethiosulfovibrio peptidovorans DSM 11002]|uniref:ABC transporter related protein n=2 Tax=Dethiosulfovibrio TaxID=47054 RepID=D2Z7U0_9BACT|nr:ABC transporter related protein [Dethiosulfovibrio peptidovorans DSM 11002]
MRAELKSVCKCYSMADGTTMKALKDLSFRIPERSFTVILGKSGCGKTTLLRIMAGLERPSTGEVLGRDGGSIGVVFQEPRLMPWLSVRKNVEMVLEGDLDRAKKAGRVLTQVGLSRFEKAMPNQLSGGMAQRVALARALAYEPEMLLMDEPFGALDYFTRRELQGELSSLVKARGLTAVLVTHDVDEAIFLASRIAVMGNGRILSVTEEIDSESMSFEERDRLRESILASIENGG